MNRFYFEKVNSCIRKILQDDLVQKGEIVKKYLIMNYTAELAFQIIQRSYNESIAN